MTDDEWTEYEKLIADRWPPNDVSLTIASLALKERRRLATDRQLLLDLATELAAGVDHSDCPTCRQLGECWYTLAVAKLDQMRGEK